MKILVTGSWIHPLHATHALLRRGDTVLGLDNLNDCYDVRLKQARLERLKVGGMFAFERLDVSSR